MVLLFKQKTAYELRISDWSSDVCSSDLVVCATDCGRCASLIACRHEQASYRSFFIDRQLAQRVLGIGREEVGGTSLRHPESQRHIRTCSAVLSSLDRSQRTVFVLVKFDRKICGENICGDDRKKDDGLQH